MKQRGNGVEGCSNEGGGVLPGGVSPPLLGKEYPSAWEMANHICPYWAHHVMPYFLARERGGKSPALRPSHPQGCRKRAFRQGQALRGRFAGLDVHALASGLIYSRATDEEASGGGSVKGSSQDRSTKTAVQKAFPAYRQAAGTYIQVRPGLRFTEFSPYMRCDRPPGVQMPAPSCAAHADLALCRMLTARLPYDVQAFVTYHLPVSRVFARRCRHACQPHAGYSSAPHPIRTRRIPDTRILRFRVCADVCSFVRHCLRGPAYVSSIRCAYSLTAGKGRCPFEPRKAQRQGMR